MTTMDSGVKPLQNAMKMAKTAIQLDGDNKHKEAYFEYLRTINYISQALLEEEAPQKEKEMVVVEVERMLRLAEQCLERAKSSIEKRSDPPDLPASTPPCSAGLSQSCHTTGFSTANTPVTDSSCIDAQHKAGSLSKRAHRHVLPEGDGELSPFPPPEVFQRFQAVASQDTCKKGLTPLEEASRLNQKLKANYEARVARLAPGQACQKTSLVSVECL